MWVSFATACEYGSENADELRFAFAAEDLFVGLGLGDYRVPETGTTLDWANDNLDQLDILY